MSEVAADISPSPSAQLSPDASLDGLPAEENMPGIQRENRRVQGLAGLADTSCVCLEAEQLKGCLNSEKIGIIPSWLACSAFVSALLASNGYLRTRFLSMTLLPTLTLGG